ncbi:signal peptidase I [Patescibacteria group bacterium]|nr:signal peptidase I [Patescibacteria group bacterium]
MKQIWEYLKLVIIAIIIIVPIRLWIAQPFIVSGASMEPTFETGDYLIIDEFTYHLEKPKKGDVIVFRYPLDTSKFFIKRIEGLPGETVNYEDREITLKDNQYFVMGDNRPASSDSRMWGPVEENLIIGRALVRLWPITKLDLLPGEINN